jgi:hypothetical protein
MRWHPKGERYKGTLHDGTITIAEDVAISEEQQAEPAFRVNIGAPGKAEKFNPPSSKEFSVDELPIVEPVISVVEEVLLSRLDISMSPIPVSSSTAFPRRPRSASI